MKNKEYWKKRFLKDKAKSINASERFINSTLSRCYKEALKNIQKDIEKFYQSFADKNHITLTEAKRLISKADFKKLDFVQRAKEQIAENKELLKKFNSLPDEIREQLLNEQIKMEQMLASCTKKGQISRLQLLQVKIEQELLYLYDKNQANLYEFLAEQYSENYYVSVFNTQQCIGFGKSFACVNTNAAVRTVMNTYGASNFSERLWGHRKNLAKELRENLTTGIIRGESLDKMARRISNRMNVSKSNAMRLVRTETAYIFEQSTKAAYEECGIESYEYLAALDYKTSAVCRELDGKKFSLKDAIPGVNYPPMHPNCRSTTVCAFDDIVSTRVAKKADGTYYDVPSSMNYQEWWNSLIEDDRGMMVLKSLMDKNSSKDLEQFRKYKNIKGLEIPKSFEKFQELKYYNNKKWNQIKKNKQKKINEMDFSEMGGLLGSLGNKETRLWYKAHDKKIPDLIDCTKPLENQARQAAQIRNTFRTQARKLMLNQEERRELDKKHPNLPFEYYVEKYKKPNADGTVPTMEEVYKTILHKSTTSNKKYDKKAGVEE